MTSATKEAFLGLTILALWAKILSDSIQLQDTGAAVVAGIGTAAAVVWLILHLLQQYLLPTDKGDCGCHED